MQAHKNKSNNRWFVKLKAQKNKHLVPSSSADFSSIEVSQNVAERSVCVYGAEDISKCEKKAKKCGEVIKIAEDRGGILVRFSTPSEASSAVLKLHGKEGIVACIDLAPPLLVGGHKQGLFVIKDLPDEISIPELWTALNGDETNLSHMSILPTSSRHVLIQCKEQDNQQVLLGKTGTRLKNWKLKVELWGEFCFYMTRRNVVLIENLPEDSTVESVKHILKVSDGLEFIEVINSHNCALVYCKTKSIVNEIIVCGEDPLKFSMYQQTVGQRYLAFIDDLHETTKEHHIHEHFKECGKILKVNVSLDQRTGLKRSVVCFQEEESVQKALQLHNSELLGNTISVQPKLKKEVYITNIHRGARPLDLCLLFQECGHINSVHVPKQKNRVHDKEAGVVVFRDRDAIPKALAKSGVKIRGLRIHVHTDDPFEHRGKQKRSRMNNHGNRPAEENDVGCDEPSPKKMKNRN